MVENLSTFNLLPNDVIKYMSKYLDDEELPILRMVSKKFANAFKNVSKTSPEKLIIHFVLLESLKHVKYLCENGCPWDTNARIVSLFDDEACSLYLNRIKRPKERRSIGKEIAYCISWICGVIIGLFFFSLPFVIIHSIN